MSNENKGNHAGNHAASKNGKRGKPRGVDPFNPGRAPLSLLFEKGFVGKVIKLGEPNGKPTIIMFTDPSGQQVTRKFPRGMCKPLEDEFEFDPVNVPLLALIERGFAGKVLELGIAGGKPTLVKFRDSAGQEVTRTFPRGLCSGLEQGFMRDHSVRLRAPARRRV